MSQHHLHDRLDEFALELHAMQQKLDALRRLADQQSTKVAPPPRESARTGPPPTKAPPVTPEPSPAVSPASPPPSSRVAHRRERRQIDFGVLLGARGLAWTGGAVTVLGVVFFFALAVDRGWIGPIERVSLGALASALIFGGGLLIQRRYGNSYASLSAVGAGIAGGYATLLFAAARYELVPDLAALAIAAAIAALGAAAAIAWSAQTLAGLGLVGAMLVPAATLLDTPHELTLLGTAFAALVLCATAAVAVRMRWKPLLAVASTVGALEILGLVGPTDGTPAAIVSLAAVYWLFFLAVAVAEQHRAGAGSLDRLPAAFITSGTVIAGVSAAQLFSGEYSGVNTEGLALLAIAGSELVLAAILYGRRLQPELGALVGIAGLTIGSVAFADLFSHATLATAWAAEAAVIAWLAPRLRDPRLQLASLAFLAAAAVHALLIDAPVKQLYVAGADPASGALAVAAVTAATVVFARCGRAWPWGESQHAGLLAFLDGPANGLATEYRTRRIAALWAAAALALYASSLGLLALFESDVLHDAWSVDTAFDWGHVAVRALLVGAALGLIACPRAGWRRHFGWGGHALLIGALAHVPRHDLESMAATPRAWVFLITAAGLLTALLVDELRRDEDAFLRWMPPAFAPVSLALATAAFMELLDGRVRSLETEDLALVGASVVYALLAALLHRLGRRTTSTALWMPALVAALWAATELLSGSLLVLAVAGAAVGAVLLARTAGERRLQLAAGALLLFALGHVVAMDAPLSDFFRANDAPAAGVPAIAFLVTAATVFAATRFAATSAAAPAFVTDLVAWKLDRRQALWRATASVGAAVLAVYGVSLVILGTFEWLGDASVATSFQRGHTAVSTFWGLIGLVTLVAGLRRSSSGLRLGGFGLFGVSLAKLFLYDLGNLSSVSRALSFLAVGAVLLLAGFFYQRLAGDTVRPSAGT